MCLSKARLAVPKVLTYVYFPELVVGILEYLRFLAFPVAVLCVVG